MAIAVSPALEAEFDSLFRSPYAEIKVERFLPEWTQVQAHISGGGAVPPPSAPRNNITQLHPPAIPGPHRGDFSAKVVIAGSGVDHAHGHTSAVAVDGNGPGEDILFRARVDDTGELQIAVIKGNDLDDPSTWEGLFSGSGFTGLVDPAWTANSGSAYGGAVCSAWNSADSEFRVFAFRAVGDVFAYDFDYNGSPTGSAQVVAAAVGNAMQIGCAKHDELFLIRHELVESSKAAWHKDIYGTNVYRYVEVASVWNVDASPFLFHTHAEGHLVKDGPDWDAGSAGVESQWGFRPNGGLGVCEIDADTVLVVMGMRFYFRKSYNVHSQAVMGFLYHRNNGLWERSFDNDDADYDTLNQLWLDVFVRNSIVDGRNVLTWVRMVEPTEISQTFGSEFIPRVHETVLAMVSDDGYHLTQFQYVGDPVGLSSCAIVGLNHAGTKFLYAIGYMAVLQSPPAGLVCDVPAAYQLELAQYTNNFNLSKTNGWETNISTTLNDASVRFNTFLREGHLMRVYYGIEGETIQVGQAYIDATQPAINIQGLQHRGPIQARAALMMLHTRAETVDDIFPMLTLTVDPVYPGGQGKAITTADGEEISVHHPLGINYHRGWWLLKKAKWPAIYFAGQYTALVDKLVYQMQAFPWAFTGGGPIDLPPGVYGGPGDIADPRKQYKKGTFFNDIVWLNMEPRIDGAVQASVRFGDNINTGNFSFEAKDGNEVGTVIYRSNGIITHIEWTNPEVGTWNDVYQESVMAGVICRAVQGELTDDVAGKKYSFVWEANSDFTTGSHLEDQAGFYWDTLVFDKPDYAGLPVGQNNLYLYMSDFDDADENWQANKKWINKALLQTSATGLTPGHPADLRMQVLGGQIHCFYRSYNTDGNPKNLWRHAFSYKSGHFGAGRFGLVGRGHSGIQWDVLYPGRDQIDLTDNVVDFWDIETTDAVKDLTLEEITTKYAWAGLTRTEYRDDVSIAGPTVVSAGNTDNSINFPVENPCIDFKVTISASGGEAGLFLRATSNANPTQACIFLGLVVNSTYKEGDNTINVYVVKRRYNAGLEVLDARNYSPCPLPLQPDLDYNIRISVRNDLYSIWIEGNYIGHFHDDTELGQYWGLYTITQDATFENIHLSELAEIPEHALLDPDQTMFDAVRRVIGSRHIKGVWRPDGDLLISRFVNYDQGPVFEDSLQQNAYQQLDRFYSAVEVQGASNRATYVSTKLLPRGRHYKLFNNPNLMTIEACYREARLLTREMAERIEQANFNGPVDPRVEPEDELGIVVAQQSINGNFLVDGIDFTYSISDRENQMSVTTRQVFLL